MDSTDGDGGQLNGDAEKRETVDGHTYAPHNNNNNKRGRGGNMHVIQSSSDANTAVGRASHRRCPCMQTKPAQEVVANA